MNVDDGYLQRREMERRELSAHNAQLQRENHDLRAALMVLVGVLLLVVALR